MAELRTRALVGVEICDVGTWDASTGIFTVTEANIDELIANFEATKETVKVPAKLGHDEGQRLLQQDGYPAVGWLHRLYRVGTKLVSDWANVPEKLAELIDAGAYRQSSVEIWHDVSVGAQKFARLLTGVAFLGEDQPAVTTLEDIRLLYGARVAALAIGPTSQVVVLERKATTKKEAGMDRKTLRAQIGELSKKFRALIKAAVVDVSQEQKRDELQDAIDDRFGGGLDGSYPYVVETFDDAVVVQKGADYFRVPYLYGADGTITFDDPVPVVQTWTPRAGDPTGGEDLPANTPSAEGTGVSTNTPAAIAAGKKKEADMDPKPIATALGLPADATAEQILASITEAKTKATELGAAAAKLVTLEGTVTELQADKVKRIAGEHVGSAIRAGKVAPAQREWAQSYAEKDPEGFTAFVEKTPALFSGERGTAVDAPEASATEQLNRLANERMAEANKGGNKLALRDAVKQVTAEQPELARQYVAERRSHAASAN